MTTAAFISHSLVGKALNLLDEREAQLLARPATARSNSLSRAARPRLEEACVGTTRDALNLRRTFNSTTPIHFS